MTREQLIEKMDKKGYVLLSEEENPCFGTILELEFEAKEARKYVSKDPFGNATGSDFFKRKEWWRIDEDGSCYMETKLG